jgi:predicted enzyme related to lactoylglutathione lyase
MNSVGLVLYPASDMPKAKMFFTTLLGTEPYVDSKPYVGFKVGEMEVGLIHQNAEGSIPAVAYVTVDDINAALETLVAAGAEKAAEPRDVGYGMLVASIKDCDGNAIGLRQFPKSQAG